MPRKPTSYKSYRYGFDRVAEALDALERAGQPPTATIRLRSQREALQVRRHFYTWRYKCWEALDRDGDESARFYYGATSMMSARVVYDEPADTYCVVIEPNPLIEAVNKAADIAESSIAEPQS